MLAAIVAHGPYDGHSVLVMMGGKFGIGKWRHDCGVDSSVVPCWYFRLGQQRLRWLGGGGNGGFGAVATQADLAAGFNSALEQAERHYPRSGQRNLTMGFAGLNAADGFHGVVFATGSPAGWLPCFSCCDAAIAGVNTGIERAGICPSRFPTAAAMWKMNLQNRFDAQNNTNSTLMAIDKLGDRILGYMANKEAADLRDEVQGYRLAASQAKQNEYRSMLRLAPSRFIYSLRPWLPANFRRLSRRTFRFGGGRLSPERSLHVNGFKQAGDFGRHVCWRRSDHQSPGWHL